MGWNDDLDRYPSWIQNTDGEWCDRYEIFHDTNPDTEWREIDGHPGYQVSDDGRIASFKGNGFINTLKTWPNQHRHQYTRLDGETVSIHRTVAKAFIPNPNNYPQVRHLNDDPRDNRVENLDWGTQKDNVADCKRNGHMVTKPVYCYEINKTYQSCAEAARGLGVSCSNVTVCCKGETGSCAGNHLCYAQDKEEKLKNINSWVTYKKTTKTVKAINLDTGEEIIFSSRKEASDKLGIPGCGISSTINGRTSHSHRWKFEDWSDEFG